MLRMLLSKFCVPCFRGEVCGGILIFEHCNARYMYARDQVKINFQDWINWKNSRVGGGGFLFGVETNKAQDGII